MRAQVYAAIIHGATGVTYFAWDTYISREPNLIGIAPQPRAEGYVAPGSGGPSQAAATSDQLAKSAALWQAVASVNAELAELTPIILSPTVDATELLYAPRISNRSAANDPAKYSSTPIRTLLKRNLQGDYVLLAVNLDDRGMDVEFKFARKMERFDLLYEDDGGNLDQLGAADSFSYRFEPYDAHIFALTPSPTGAILGDFDGDDAVDGEDLAVWQRDFGELLDGAELLTWQRGFGAVAVASTPVPEGDYRPAVLLALGLRRGWLRRAGIRGPSTRSAARFAACNQTNSRHDALAMIPSPCNVLYFP